MYMCMLSRFSCIQLFETLWTVAPQVPLSLGFSGQEYWSGLPCPPPPPGELPNPETEPASPALYADSLPSEPQGTRVSLTPQIRLTTHLMPGSVQAVQQKCDSTCCTLRSHKACAVCPTFTVQTRKTQAHIYTGKKNGWLWRLYSLETRHVTAGTA